MKYERTENRSAFYYSKNLLDRLLRLNVITVNEYEKILLFLCVVPVYIGRNWWIRILCLRKGVFNFNRHFGIGRNGLSVRQTML